MRRSNISIERHNAGFAFAEQVCREDSSRPTSHPAVEDSLHYIRRHYSKSINIRDVRARTALSARGFHKAFVGHTGMTPGVVLRCVRMQRAKALLLETDKGIAEIVQLVGYRSVNSFTIAFKATIGVSPGAFRSRFRRVTFDGLEGGRYTETASLGNLPRRVARWEPERIVST